MSRNASGNYSLPGPETPFIPNTSISSTDMNTVFADIETEITNSLDRGGRGAMTAPLVVPSGSAAAPSLTFNGDTNTGAYAAAADTLGFATGGAVRGQFSANGLLTVDGALATPALSFISDANTGLYRAGADDLRLVAGGVSIGAVTTKLSVSAATAATGGTRQDALSLTNGDLDLSAVTAPTSTTGISNRLTKLNLIKAFAVITIDGSGTPFTVTVHEAFNITSVTATAPTAFTVAFASNFAGTTYGVVGQVINGLVGGQQILVNPTTRNVGSNVVGLTSTAGGSITMDSWGNIVQVLIIYLGAQ